MTREGCDRGSYIFATEVSNVDLRITIFFSEQEILIPWNKSSSKL